MSKQIISPDQTAPEVPEPVLLIMVDISGYTRFMTANAKTLAHSQVIITELIKAVVQEAELPLEIAKLEGDAVFLYCRKQNCTRPWPEVRRIIGAKLLVFFRLFNEKAAELSASTTCNCNACTHIQRLRLKVIVHSGEALFHRIFQFVELAGVDVIILHRLLKNAIPSDQYLLMTEAALDEVELPAGLPLIKGSETYDELGRINTFHFLPDGRVPAAVPPPASTFGQRFQNSWRLFRQFWLSPLNSRYGQSASQYHHLDSGTSRAGKTGFVFLTALLTPIFLPAGILFAGVHALRNKPGAGVHVHGPDCGCGEKH